MAGDGEVAGEVGIFEDGVFVVEDADCVQGESGELVYVGADVGADGG